MKLILIMMILMSCAQVQKRVPKKKFANEKLKECVIELIGVHGVKALTAQEVCEKIYKRSE